MESRVVARFVPQVWIDDYAVEVEPEGPAEWDVTDAIEHMGPTAAARLRDDQYETDELRYHANAPEWVREWSGPFFVSVELSILDFLATGRTVSQ